MTAATVAGTAAMYAMSRAITATIANGIKYNKAIEDSKAGLTALAVAVQDKAIPVTERYNQAQKESVATLKELQKINTQTPHSLNQTNQIYKAMYVSMRNVGATTTDMVELTRSLSIASGAAGIEFNSLLAGVDGLASGTVLANSDLGRFLGSIGLTNEALKGSDDVVKLLNESLKDFKAADTLGVAISNLGNEWDVLSGKLTVDIFKGSKDGANELAKLLGDMTDNEINNLKSSMNQMAIAGTTAIYGLAVGVVELTNVFERMGTIISGTMFYIKELYMINDAEQSALDKMYQTTRDNIAAREAFLVTLDKSKNALIQSVQTSEVVTSKKKEETEAFVDSFEKTTQSTNATQELADMEAQLAVEALAVANSMLNETDAINKSTDAVNKKTDAINNSTIAIQNNNVASGSSSGADDMASRVSDQKNRLGQSDDEYYTVTYAPINNTFDGIFGSFNDTFEETTTITDSYNTTINAVDNSMRDFQSTLKSIDGALNSSISSMLAVMGSSSINQIGYQQAYSNVLSAREALLANPLSPDLSTAYSSAYSQFQTSASSYTSDSSKFGSAQEQKFASATVSQQDLLLQDTALLTYDVQEEMKNLMASIDSSIADGILTAEEKATISGVADSVNTKNDLLLGASGVMASSLGDIDYSVGSQTYFNNTGLAKDSSLIGTNSVSSVISGIDSSAELGTLATATGNVATAVGTSNTKIGNVYESLGGKSSNGTTIKNLQLRETHKVITYGIWDWNYGEVTAENTSYSYYKRGGFTDKGESDKEAGVVHAGEWVAPKWMVNSNTELFRSLDNARQNNGFQVGGYTPTSTTVSQSPSSMDGQKTNGFMFAIVDELKKQNRLLSKVTSGGDAMLVELTA